MQNIVLIAILGLAIVGGLLFVEEQKSKERADVREDVDALLTDSEQWGGALPTGEESWQPMRQDESSATPSMNMHGGPELVLQDGSVQYVFPLLVGWRYQRSSMHGGPGGVPYEILDEQGRLFARVTHFMPPVGMEGSGTFDKSTFKTRYLGELQRIDVRYNDNTGRLIFISGPSQENPVYYVFQIDIFSRPTPLPRNPGEYERGTGIPVRYRSYDELLADMPTIEAFLNAAYKTYR